MKTLFPKRKPKILKYTPSPYVRKMESVEFDVKSDYRKFAEFLRLSSDDLGRVKLPKKDELRKLNKETKPKPGKEDGGFGGLIGKLISSLPVIGAIAIPALKIGAIAALGLGVSSLFGTQPSTMGLGSSLFRPKQKPRKNIFPPRLTGGGEQPKPKPSSATGQLDPGTPKDKTTET